MSTVSTDTSVKKIELSLATPHVYLAEDDSEFQSVIREVTEEYIERKQDEALKAKIKDSKKLHGLERSFSRKYEMYKNPIFSQADQSSREKISSNPE